jgi:hypothetical protein
MKIENKTSKKKTKRGQKPSLFDSMKKAKISFLAYFLTFVQPFYQICGHKYAVLVWIEKA